MLIRIRVRTLRLWFLDFCSLFCQLTFDRPRSDLVFFFINNDRVIRFHLALLLRNFYVARGQKEIPRSCTKCSLYASTVFEMYKSQIQRIFIIVEQELCKCMCKTACFTHSHWHQKHLLKTYLSRHIWLCSSLQIRAISQNNPNIQNHSVMVKSAITS